jgi:fibronectin type 3 domain-containing protein
VLGSATPRIYGSVIDVAWGPAADNGVALGAYFLEADTGGGFTQRQVLAGGAGSGKFSAACGVSAVVRVRAQDALGAFGPYSNTIASSIPCAPSLLPTPVIASGQLTLNWLTPTAQVQGLGSSYVACTNVAGLSDAQFSALAPAAPTGSSVLTIPNPNESWWYRVYEVDDTGATSSASAEIAVMPPPVISAVRPKAAAVYLRWQSVKSATAPNVTGYALYYDTSPVTSSSPVSVVAEPGIGIFAALTLSPLTDGTDYYFGVAARGGGQEGTLIALTFTVRASYPNPGIKSLIKPLGGAVNLSWNSADLSGGALSLYQIYRSTAIDGTYAPRTLMQSTGATVTAAVLPSALTGSVGVTDYYYVTAMDTLGLESSVSPSAGSTVAVANLDIPVVAAPVTGNARVLLNWSPVAGASQYLVYRSSSLPFPIAPLADGLTTGLSYTDSNPYNGQLNYYQVTARQTLAFAGSYVESTPSASVSAQPFINPGMPGFNGATMTSSVNYYLTVTASLPLSQQTGQASVDLKWAKAPAGSLLVAGYQAYQGPLGMDAPLGATLTVLPSTVYPALTSTAYPLTVTASNLDAGGIYTFSVDANDAAGNRGARLVRTVTLSPPSAPQFLSAQAMFPSAGKAKLNWSAPSSQPNPVTAYDIWVSSSPNLAGSPVASVTSTTYVDSQPSNVYYQYYRVFARDDLGLSSSNYALVGVTLRAAPTLNVTPTMVSAVTASSLPGAAVLIQWSPNPSGEQVTTYYVYRDGTLVTPIGTNQYQFTDSVGAYSAPANITYTVQAQNTVGVGVSGTAAGLAHLPPPPTGLKLIVDPAGANSTGLTLSWDSLAVDSYTLYRSLGPFTTPAAATAIPGILTTIYTDTAVVSGNSYEYRIASFDNSSGLVGPPSATGQTFLAANLPAMPIGFAATALTSGGAVSLTWTSGAASTVKFWVFRDTVPLNVPPLLSTFYSELVASPSGFNRFTDFSAQAETNYYYAVASLDYNGRGTEATDGPILAKTGAPYGLTAAAAAGGVVDLSWQVPASTYAQGTYDLYRDTSPAFSSPTFIVNLPVTNPPQTVLHTDSTVVVDTPYYYRAQATGGNSNMITITAHGQPSSLASSLTATATAGGVSLAWATPSSSEAVTGYQIYYAHSGLPLGVTTSVGVGSSFAIGGVVAGDWVTATVQALNSWGLGNSASVEAGSNLASGAFSPLSFTVKAGFVESLPSSSHLDLSWTKAGAANAFEIYRSTASIPLSLAQGGSSSIVWQKEVASSVSAVADLGVTASTNYYYALAAVSPTGLPGGESYPVFFGPVTPFNYPSLVSFTVAAGGDARADLAWTSPKDSGTAGLAAEPYSVYRYAYPGPSAPAFKSQAPDSGFPVTTTSNAFTDFNVSNGSRYLYYVSVTDSLLREQTKPSSVALIPAGLSKPPLQLKFIPGDNLVTVQWLAQQVDNAKYNVYRRDAATDNYAVLPLLREVGPSAYNSGTQVVETLVDSTARNTFNYCYAMASVSVTGEGPKSAEVCVTPFKPLDPSANPVVTLAVVNRKDAKLSWVFCPDQSIIEGYTLAGYRIYRSKDGGSTFVTITADVAPASPVITFTDATTQFGVTYVYRVVPVDFMGNEGVSYHVVIVSIPAPINNVLIFRNSFNPDLGETVPVQFVLLVPGHAWVKVYTLQGDYVATLFEEDAPPSTGINSPYLSDKKTWDGRNALGQVVASGVYLVHLEANGFNANGRVAVIK